MTVLPKRASNVIGNYFREKRLYHQQSSNLTGSINSMIKLNMKMSR